MVILAVDTCLEPGSVALQEADRTPEIVPLPPGWRSTTIQETIARLLARNGLTTADIGGYGVTAGPGSFTGVRIGLTVVKALAEVHSKPIVAVSTLEVLAAAARQAVGIEEPVLLAPIQDARRGQVFAAVYQMQKDNIPPVIPATVCSLHSFFQQVKARQLSHVRFCAVELAPFLSEVPEADWGPEAVVTVTPCLAGVLAETTSAGLRKGRGLPASEVDANYVRASDAELFWKE